MNTRRSRPVHRCASVLLASLLFIAILSLVLASYLGLSAAQTVSVARSQAWNAAIAVAEAGVEESLAQLNAGIGIGALNLAANGWEAKAGGNYGPLQPRYLGSNYYDVIIVPGTKPMICSTGYTAAPFRSAPISRAVQVTTEYTRLFVSAMAAKEDIDFKGFNPTTDSFDSSQGPYGSTAPRDHGDVNTTSGFVNVGNAKLKGKARSGPNGGIVSGSNGSVGSSAWVDGGNTGIQPGWSANDFNVEFPIVYAPYSSGFSPQPGTDGGTNYAYVLDGNKYMTSSLGLKSSDVMLVRGHATLYVTGDVLMQSKSQILILPGASLDLYVGGDDLTSPTSAVLGQINNQGTAQNFSYYGLPNNTSVSFGGNSAVNSVIYCPSAQFTLGGGGADTFDFQGSVMARSIKLNGHFNFHFDEDLAKNGPVRGYVATSWKEL